MSRRIAFLVAAISAAIVLVFLLPLGFLVRSLAYDRASAAADQEARNIAILVSSLHSTPELADVVAAVNARAPASTTVVLANGKILGDRSVTRRDPDVVRARQGSAFSHRTASGGLRIVVSVLTSNGTDVVVTEVTEDDLDAGVHEAWITLGILGVILIGAASAVAFRVARQIATPVRRVADVADRLREGDLDARAKLEGTDETRALAEALNRLGARIQELLVAERGAAGDLAHRLRTPVTALRIDLDGMPEHPLADRLQDHLMTLQRTIDVIVEDARRPVRHSMQAECDALAVFAERLEFWRPLAEDQERALTVSASDGESALVALDQRDLADVLDIVLDNVFSHTREGTRIDASALRADDAVMISVQDRGGWKPPGDSKPGHTGLGLQLARRLVETAGGSLAVTGEDDGTSVVLDIPVTQ